MGLLYSYTGYVLELSILYCNLLDFLWASILISQSKFAIVSRRDSDPLQNWTDLSLAHATPFHQISMGMDLVAFVQPA